MLVRDGERMRERENNLASRGVVILDHYRKGTA
jgi:hypothetical protein